MSERTAPIVVERVIGAPVADVFGAWRDPESVALWMCPGPDFRPASVSLDFRPGGRFEIVMHADRDYGQKGEYVEIVDGKRIVMRWISDFVPEAESETLVTVTFEPVGEEATRVVLVHDRLPDSDTYDGHTDGWTFILQRMQAVVEGGQ